MIRCLGIQEYLGNMTVISAKMKEAGYNYATHQVGKWDAGMATPDHTPKGRGFDSSLDYFHHALNGYFDGTEGITCNTTMNAQECRTLTAIYTHA